MFDLLALCDLGPNPGALPAGPLALPGEPWAAATAAQRRGVTGRGLRAAYLERPGERSYAEAAGRRLFVVGEAWARSDWSWPDRRPAGPLAASEVLALYERHGERCLAALKGNFNLVLFDTPTSAAGARDLTTPTCLICAGRYAISPFYYAAHRGRLACGTALAEVAAAAARVTGRPADIDPAGVLELALFNYPLAARTYMQGVRMLRPGEIVRITTAGVTTARWWDVRSLCDQPALPEPIALEQGSALFHSTVNALAADQPRVRVSFTSGFDSRAIMAVLDRPATEIQAYAFGTPGSLNVDVPEAICAGLGVPFAALRLGAEYEQVYDENARRAVLLSDGLSTLERANYPYAFEKLAGYAPVVLTGLFGSELLRTFQNVGHLVSEAMLQLAQAAEPLAAVPALLASLREPGYLADNMVSAGAAGLADDVAAALGRPYGDLPFDRRIYMILLTEALRKYFGAEVHMERPWGANRFPFLDDEFVEFAFRAPFAGVHAGTLQPSVQNRFRSQYFYAYVIRKYRPELLHATTDHGYPPGDVLSRVALLKIGPQLLRARQQKRRSNYREFYTEEWSAALYERTHLPARAREGLFSPRLAADWRSGAWLGRRVEFARAVSLAWWLELAGCA